MRKMNLYDDLFVYISLCTRLKEERAVGRINFCRYLLFELYRLCRYYFVQPHNKSRGIHKPYELPFVRQKDMVNMQCFIHFHSDSPRDKRILNNKQRFQEYMSQAGIKTTMPVACLQKDDDPSTSEVRQILENQTKIFVKPANGVCGENVASYERIDQDRYKDDSEKLYTIESLADRLLTEMEKYPVLIEEFVVNHSVLYKVTSFATSTLRVVTYRGQDGSIHPLLAVERFARIGTVADNLALGGIAAPLDLESGRLGRATDKTGKPSFSHHPDTAVEIAGTELPYFVEALRLACLAHSLLPELFSVGWDIVITATGPLLLEGNSIWCADLAQKPFKRSLLEYSWLPDIMKNLNAAAQGKHGVLYRRIRNRTALD